MRENRLVLRRIHDAGGLTRSAFRAAYDAETGRLRAASAGSGGDFYLTLGARVGRRFARAIVTSILERRTSFTESFRLLGFRRMTTFNRLAGHLGIDFR